MKVKELIEILQEYNEDIEVLAACEGYGHAIKLERRDIRPDQYSEFWGDKLQLALTIITGRSQLK